jgi:hypothetical protein
MAQLTEIAPEELPAALAAFARGVAGDKLATATFEHVAGTGKRRADDAAQRTIAIAWAQHLGMAVIDEEPSRAFSWDGRALRTRSEPCVLFHEIAHWQLAAPARRSLPDFGLGAGPETGRKVDADRARVAGDEERIAEECAASLLGILWEAACGGRAIDAFLEQNWLERYDGAGTHRLYMSTLDELFRRNLIGADGIPTALATPARAAPAEAHALVFADPS